MQLCFLAVYTLRDWASSRAHQITRRLVQDDGLSPEFLLQDPLTLRKTLLSGSLPGDSVGCRHLDLVHIGSARLRLSVVCVTVPGSPVAAVVPVRLPVCQALWLGWDGGLSFVWYHWYDHLHWQSVQHFYSCRVNNILSVLLYWNLTYCLNWGRKNPGARC